MCIRDSFYEVMSEYLPEQSRGDDPPLMGVSDRDTLRQAALDAGFSEAVIESLPIVWELDSPDRHFDALASLRDLSALSGAEVAEFRADVARRAEEFRSGGRLLIPFPALVMTVTKAANSA